VALADHLKTIKTQKLYHHAASQILSAIRTGVLRPGDALPSERKLAEAFGVSRASVREALRALEVLGVIDSRRGSGSYITLASQVVSDQAIGDLEEGFDPWDFIEARSAIESEIAAHAAKRRTKEDLLALAHFVEVMERAVADQHLDLHYHEADFGFHERIAIATQNRFFVEVMQSLVWRRRRQVWHLVAERLAKLPGMPVGIGNQHVAILTAIQNGNSRGARRAMIAHLAAVRRNLDRYKSVGGRPKKNAASLSDESDAI